MKKHYDSVRTTSTSERARGDLFELKKFHNAEKRRVIEEYAKICDATSLLDLACGRGGDLQKWVASGLEFVRGLDQSSVEIQEARRRARSLRDPGNLETHFEVFDLLTTVYADPDGCAYDMVSMNFALNYFWETEETASRILESVSQNLRPGGVFIACWTDGAAVDAYDGRSTYLQLRKLYDSPEEFGAKYTFSLRDTVTSGDSVDTANGIVEYLVTLQSLARLADRFGLVFVDSWMFEPRRSFEGHEASRLFQYAIFTKSV